MPVDRTLAIELTFSGAWNPGDATTPAGYYGTATYAQLSSTPNMPGVVASDGTINVPDVDDPASYSSNCDITFSLSPNSCCVLQDGTTHAPVTWAQTIGSDLSTTAMIVGNKVLQGGGYTIIPNPLMYVSFVAGSNNTLIVIDDDDAGSNAYYYRPAVIVPTASDYYISCDPQMTVKP